MKATVAPRVPNAPLVFAFLAVATGVLLSAKFPLGLRGWTILFFGALGAFFLTKAVVFRLVRADERVGRFLDGESTLSTASVDRALRATLRGTPLLFVALASLAGARYELHYNYFPRDEIGFLADEDGGVATLELRALKTPNLNEIDATSRSPYGDDLSTSFLAEALRARVGGEWREASGRVAVNVSGDATFIRIGDRFTATGRLTRPAAPGNPGDRDRRFYYRSRRVLTTLSVKRPDFIEPLSTTDYGFKTRVARKLERLRLRAAQVLRDRLSPRNAAVAVGMTFGFRGDVDQETSEAFRRAGVVHLLAISGLHVGLVVGAFVFVLYRLRAPLWATSVATLALVWTYASLTSMQAPVIRAAALTSAFACGSLLNRKGNALNSLLFAAIALLTVNPCELFQLGAQLSFLATGAFLWLYDATSAEKTALREERARIAYERRIAKERRRREARRAKRRAAGLADDDSGGFGRLQSTWAFFARLVRGAVRRARALFLTGIVVWGVGTPLVASATNLFTPIAVVANPIVWLPATLSLFAAFFLAFAGLVVPTDSGLGGAAMGLATVGTDAIFTFFLNVLEFFASARGGALRVATPEKWALVLFYFPLIFWTLFPNRRPRARVLVLCLAIWCVALCVVGRSENAAIKRSGRVRVDVFAIGHGGATLAFFPDGRVLLYDCGSMSGSRRAADVVAKNLWDARKTRVDLAIISHADYDHYGGFERLCELVKIDRVCVSPALFEKENETLTSLKEALMKNGATIETLRGGETLERFGFPEATILHPIVDERGEIREEGSNANSVVLLLNLWGRRMVLPGDLDSGEALFLSQPSAGCDVALAPHHGGKTENFDEFYAWADPSVVVISGGAFLRSLKSENLLREQGREVFHTNDDGDAQIFIERPKSGASRGATTVRAYRSGRVFAFD